MTHLLSAVAATILTIGAVLLACLASAADDAEQAHRSGQ